MGAEAPKTAFPRIKGEVVVFDVATTGAIHVKQPSIPDCDLVHPCHQEVTVSRRRGGVQFLTRSHRTVKDEDDFSRQGLALRVITTPLM